MACQHCRSAMQDACRAFASETSGKKKYELYMQAGIFLKLLADTSVLSPCLRVTKADLSGAQQGCECPDCCNGERRRIQCACMGGSIEPIAWLRQTRLDRRLLTGIQALNRLTLTSIDDFYWCRRLGRTRSSKTLCMRTRAWRPWRKACSPSRRKRRHDTISRITLCFTYPVLCMLLF